MTIGDRIKQARTEKGLTQKQLGIISETSEITIRQYELGKRQPRIEQLQRIASALDVDVNWLMNGQTLEQRDQAWKDRVKERFANAELAAASADKMVRSMHLELFEYEDELNKIDSALSMLNTEGRQKAVERVEELAEIPRYRRQKPAGALPASSKDTDDG